MLLLPGPAVRAKLSSGILVVVDNNIATNLGAGTNEDEIYVVPASECHLWQDPAAPMLRTGEHSYPSARVIGADVRLGDWRGAGSSRESGPAPYPDSVELFREGQGRVV